MPQDKAKQAEYMRNCKRDLTILTEIIEKDVAKLFKSIIRAYTGVSYYHVKIFETSPDMAGYLCDLLIKEPKLSESIHSGWEKSDQGVILFRPLNVSLLINTNPYVFKTKGKVVYPNSRYWKRWIGIDIIDNLSALLYEREYGTEYVRRISGYKRGYIIWVNWHYETRNCFDECKKEVEKYTNVKLFYLDICSDPIKTNVSNL